MKRRLAVLIALMGLCLILSSCGIIRIGGDRANTSENTTNEAQNDTPVVTDDTVTSEPEQDSKEDTTDVDPELAKAVDSVIEATFTEDSIEDKVVTIYNDEVDNRTKYYSNSDILKAMAKDSTLGILVKSDNISTEAFDKQSKSEYNVAVKNEMGDTSNLKFIKVDDDWKLDISSMIASAYIAAPRDITIKLNGVEVTKDLIENKAEQDIYKIPNVLNGITAIVEYDTGLGSEFSKEIAIGTEKPVNVRYELSDEDLSTILPMVEELWKSVKQAAINGDTASMQKSLADDAQVSVDALMTAFNADEYDTSLMSFIKRSDDKAIAAENVCYLSGENTYMLNLLGKFNMANFSGFGAKTPTSYCWVEVENTDNGLKIRQASEDVWLKRVNAYSNDM